MEIREFKGDYAWLSNFYFCDIVYEGQYYTSAEAAFQAQKCVDEEEKKAFITLPPGKAKRFGMKVKLRPDWEKVKEQIMYEILLFKFLKNVELKDKLIATGDAFLAEGNYWGDKFWGICPADGELGKDGLNKLGELLMLVRTVISYIFKS